MARTYRETTIAGPWIRALISSVVMVLLSAASYRAQGRRHHEPRRNPLSVQFNHTIVGCRDNRETAEFWADILGLDIGKESGPFIPIAAAHGATFDFARVPPHMSEIQPQHYAFLVSEAEFDAAYAKIQRYRLEHWADPRKHGVNEINHNDGGRGVYFLDPNGHFLELITVPYGGWPT